MPFSTSPGRQPIVLSRGDFACLDYLDHQPEAYRLTAGIHVDREALLTQRLATVLVRPGLYLNGTPVSVKLLEEVKLRITATDQDGIADDRWKCRTSSCSRTANRSTSSACRRGWRRWPSRSRPR